MLTTKRTAKHMKLRELVGMRLRFLRKERKFTQERLSEAVGVSDKQIRRWESGEDQPTYEHMEQLASSFDVKPRELFPD